jgi:hypothetical protein
MGERDIEMDTCTSITYACSKTHKLRWKKEFKEIGKKSFCMSYHCNRHFSSFSLISGLEIRKTLYEKGIVLYTRIPCLLERLKFQSTFLWQEERKKLAVLTGLIRLLFQLEQIYNIA